MSEQVCCDVCGTIGRRRRMTWAPDGWFYAEATDEKDKSNTIIVWVCSEECKNNFWMKGPGKMDPEEVMKA